MGANVASLAVPGGSIDHVSSGAGPLVVLVHGSWVDRTSWDQLVPYLTDGLQVVAYSRRGHGDSAGNGAIDDDVEDLAALIEHYGLEGAHLVGNSMGATICLRLAIRRPDLVRSLALHEPPLFGLIADDPAWAEAGAEANARVAGVLTLIGDGQAAAAAERFVDEVALGSGAWAQMPAELQRVFIANARTFLEECEDPTAYWLDVDSLRALEPAVLLSGGTDSPPLFAPVLDRLQDALSRTERHTVAGAGHVPQLTHLHQYCEVVRTFIGGRSADNEGARR